MPFESALVLIAAGFAILLFSGDSLVRGALAASLKANISPLAVGILVVGLGTSVPEFFVVGSAASEGKYGLAHGTIVGSNIANLWVVMALPGLIWPMSSVAPRVRITAFFMLCVTAAWIGVTWAFGLNPLIGLAGFGLLACYMALAFFTSGRDNTANETPADKKYEKMSLVRMATLIAIGVVGLPLGAQFLINGGMAAAASTGVSQEVVGLTLLAVGTSLPELGAGVAAAMRRHSDMALGNVLGSNIFNILGAGGIVALTGAHQLAPEFHQFSHWALGLSALTMTLVIFLKRKIGIVTGLIFVWLYAAYVIGLVNGWTIEDLPLLFLEEPAVPPA